MTRRYVVVGAGAVGGTLGGALTLAGCDVRLVARGGHLEALRARGLTLVTPSRTHALRLPLAERVEDVAHGATAVIVATKSQDTAAALAGLRDPAVPIVCAQNGVDNEALVASRFQRVLGMVVFAPLSHLEPGVVTAHDAPSLGGIDLGVWPEGLDDLAALLGGDLVRGGFDVRLRLDVARWKYGKLLSNLGNVLEALGGRAALRPEWIGLLVAEGEACLRAAGIAFATVAEIHARFADVGEVLPRRGGSTWQSLSRGVPLETEHLNGTIARLGREHGIATPMNDAVIALARRATDERWAAGEADLAQWM